jgi:hypothetical protein
MPGPPDKFIGLQSKDYADAVGLAQALSAAHDTGYANLFATLPDPRDVTNTWLIVGGYPEK